VDSRNLVYAPRAQRDVLALEKRFARQVLADLEILTKPPWPRGKVKPLRGTDYWEIKTGDFRAIFLPRGRDVIILRVVDRRDLHEAIGRIDVAALVRWLQQRR
jgi:mRNA-degrading endonuclease RelE of RelBE toxin-antitoxin system